ncbi:glutaredoxin domain-containing cysteine-rich protein CG12206 [Coffea eugenioides]|uniref:glutaredoxin domain-containing cysteine-rich protein CG12206 n=1 Tax=Coffea eugenioides TaxID=49369 RepID=UPI000F608BDE|nr:glutaredoxin domain-containing cysteine-rich protein CG12206 [Coffea eugenioides]
MTVLQTSCFSIIPSLNSKFNDSNLIIRIAEKQRKQPRITSFAAKSGGFSLNSILKKCERCGGQGAIECPGCKGTGKNKKNGNIFERWKCFDCQGFGLKSCPVCGKGGLTPEQRGER